MIELLLWIVFGVLSGWIGYLVTRNDDRRSLPYLVTGIVGAVIGGYTARNLGAGTEDMLINTASLFVALATAVVCVLIISFFGRESLN